MQCHLNDLAVHNVQNVLVNKPTVDDHLVIIPSDEDDMSLQTPFQFYSVTSYFPVWSSTLSEYKNDDIPKFHSIAKVLMRDPSLSLYYSQEDIMLNFREYIISIVTTTREQITMHKNVVAISPFAFYCVIDATMTTTSAYIWSPLYNFLCLVLARLAVIHDKAIQPNCAKSTVQQTTQRGLCMITNPGLSQQFCTNNHVTM